VVNFLQIKRALPNTHVKHSEWTVVSDRIIGAECEMWVVVRKMGFSYPKFGAVICH
jgi:hypothetical protein